MYHLKFSDPDSNVSLANLCQINLIILIIFNIKT